MSDDIGHPWPPADTDPLIHSLRGALDRTADEVTPPRDGLRRIRAEIAARELARRRARRQWLTGLAAAVAGVLVTGGLVTALGRSDRDGSVAFGTSPTVGSGTPPGFAQPGTTPSSSRSGSGGAGSPTGLPGVAEPALPVYYCGRGAQAGRLFREFHPVVGSLGTPGTSGTTGERVQTAIAHAMSLRPDDPDYQSLWAAGAGARTTVTDDLITIVLNQNAAGGISLPNGTLVDQSQLEVAALQQLIWTATAAAAPAGSTGPTLVRISAEGPTPNRFGAISLSLPFRRGDQPGGQDPRAAVWIDSLAQNAAVPVGQVTVRGQATGASAPHRWTLTQDETHSEGETPSPGNTLTQGEISAQGPVRNLRRKTVASGSITPRSTSGTEVGIGVRGIWTMTLDLPAPGRYRLTVALADGSGSDTKDIIASRP